MSTEESFQSLTKPLMRDPEGGIKSQYRVKINLEPGKLWNYANLLAAVQDAEEELITRKRAKGIDFRGCGDSRLGVIRGGSAEHVIEHALAAVMDFNAPLEEQSTGNTHDIGGQRDEFGRMIRRYVIDIAPPPSMDLKTATKLCEQGLHQIEEWNNKGGELNLNGIRLK